ncbi:RibD family protein [Candidatus Daviesbacteria bacterium]|nr:RibD family protein [Candidatus Daviesbacteria bacterium]
MYLNLKFPKLKNRPFFYTNFVETLDGKVQVLNKDKEKYWPIGTDVDLEAFRQLRANADLLIHGKLSAFHFRTVDSLSKDHLRNMRKKLNKNEFLPYMIISNHSDERLIEYLENTHGIVPILATSQKSKVPEKLTKIVEIVRIGKEDIDLKKLSEFIFKNGYKNVLVEGGPNLVGSFLKIGLIDEVFLTLAPKIFGNLKGETLTMVEGVLLPPDKIKKLHLLSIKKVRDEVFLRYRII